MDLKQMFARMGSGEVSAHSELGTRDESKQAKSYDSRLRKLKATVGIKAHAMVMKDAVIPFNPFTGEQDDTYNSKTPFRPILLVSQVLEGIKSWCSENPASAEFWARTLSLENIDWAAAPTMEEYYAFKSCGFIKPRIMSYSTVTLNFNSVGGFSEFATKYSVDPSQLNENNNYDYDNAPVWHQAAIFFNSMLKPEVDERVKALEKANANKEQIKAERQAIYAKSPVGFVTQTNLIPFLYFPMTVEDDSFKNWKVENPMEVEKAIRWMSYNSEKWSTAISEAMTNNIYDTNMDYFDLTIRTPDSTQTKSNGQVYTDEDVLELYKAMNVTSTDARMAIDGGSSIVKGSSVPNAEMYPENVWAAVRAYFNHSQEQSGTEGGETFEKLMAASNGFRPITGILDKFMPACNEVFLDKFADSKYFTDNVKKANAEFFAAMDPKNALALAAEDDEDLEAAKKEQATQLAALIAETQPEGDVSSLDIEGVNVSIE